MPQEAPPTGPLRPGPPGMCAFDSPIRTSASLVARLATARKAGRMRYSDILTETLTILALRLLFAHPCVFMHIPGCTFIFGMFFCWTLTGERTFCPRFGQA